MGVTTESRELAYMLAERGFAVTVCVATQYGGELLSGIDNINYHVGRLSAIEMTDFITAGAFELS